MRMEHSNVSALTIEGLELMIALSPRPESADAFKSWESIRKVFASKCCKRPFHLIYTLGMKTLNLICIDCGELSYQFCLEAEHPSMNITGFKELDQRIVEEHKDEADENSFIMISSRCCDDGLIASYTKENAYLLATCGECSSECLSFALEEEDAW